MANYRVGAARFRQLRMPYESPSLGLNISYQNLVRDYHTADNERDDYCIGWKSPPCDPEEALNYTTSSWTYQTASESEGAYMVRVTILIKII